MYVPIFWIPIDFCEIGLVFLVGGGGYWGDVLYLSENYHVLNDVRFHLFLYLDNAGGYGTKEVV